jgi:signal transduction histidine kinase/CheY-like chemotaxis protein
MAVKTSIRTKIAITCFVGAVALCLAFFINSRAYKAIHSSVDELTNPQVKLSLVNNILFQIQGMEDAYQEAILAPKSKKINEFIARHDSTVLVIQSFQEVSKDDTLQLALTDSILHLLAVRQSILQNYFFYRKKLITNQPFKEQLLELDSTLQAQSTVVDSLVIQRKELESNSSYDTIGEEGSKNWWSKIFGSSKKKSPIIKRSETNSTETTTDTLLLTKKNYDDSLARSVINEIIVEQESRRSDFFSREAELNKIDHLFHLKINELLLTVQRNIEQQTKATSELSEQTISSTLNTFIIVIVLFIVLSTAIAIMIAWDVTRANRYREQLELAKLEAEQNSITRQRFLSNMSHEIRTPLQSIVGYSDMLHSKFPREKYVSAIMESSHHLLEIVNEILDFQKIQTAGIVLRKEPYDLLHAVEQVKQIFELEAAKRSISLTTEYQGVEEVLLNGDEYRIKQILINLIGNAIKFTTEGGIHVKVDVVQKPKVSYLQLEVSDTGVGIPAADQDRIFQEFEQIEVPMEKRRQGTGLGLSIVKSIVEAHKGRIQLKSEEGKGTSITITLPAEILSEGITSSVITVPSFHLPKSLELWMVDDDELILSLVSKMLHQQDIHHRVFNNADAMLHAAESGRPHVVLIDYRMPDMNGLDVLVKLKSILPSFVRYISVTAQALPEEMEELRRTGFEDILLKPFRVEDFISMLEKQFQRNSETLTAMFGDDHATIHTILTQFKEDTAIDLHLLRSFTDTTHTDDYALLFHRVAGRCGQVGFSYWSMYFRCLELECRAKKISVSEQEKFVAEQALVFMLAS